jgi:hypothetical protein
MTAPIGISWETPRDCDVPAGGDDDCLPSRIHAARDCNSTTLLVDWSDPNEVKYHDWPRKASRPSLWQRLKSWAENLFTDPEGDDE